MIMGRRDLSYWRAALGARSSRTCFGPKNSVAAFLLAMSGRLSAMVAGGVMLLSNVLVLSNSLRLRCIFPQRQ
jgi:hypothetical protein